MNRRTPLLILAAIAFLGALLTAGPAMAALREVRVGNFYYDDDTAGDGQVVADQGDQLRFTVLDGGPGTPHTVEIDEFGIHSGSLASGETYTTPPLDRPGTYRLYCRPHQNRGHEAILIVRATSTPTAAPTTAPPTTAPPPDTQPPSTAPPAESTPTTAPAGSETTMAPDTITPGDGSNATSTPSTSTPTGAADTTGGDEPPSGTPDDATTDPTLVPVGRGAADDSVLDAAPADPDSLEAAIGRPAAQRGPWTRSVRLGLVALVAMAVAAGAAALRGRRTPSHPD